MIPRYFHCVLTPIAVLAYASAAQAAPLGPAFTYQGQLKQGGAPENGNFNMEFRLFDAATTPLGNQVGNPVTLNGVAVSNGQFTVTLNAAGEFGPSAFNGEERWLAIVMGGTPLTPRQKITAAPYAVHALNAPDGHSLDAADGNPINAVYVNNDGNVGIGTTTPRSPLSFANILGNKISLWGGDTARYGFGIQSGLLQIHTDQSTSDIAFGHGESEMFAEKMRIKGNGNVGIGTQAPVAGLHVEGPGHPKSFLYLNSTNSTGGNNDSGLRLMRGGDVYWHVFNSESTGDSFNLNNALFGPILVATQGGNVGIGTDNPDAKLRVAGGNVKLDSAATITSAGRLHIQSDPADDLLFLNPWSGTTYVGHGGGPGNLNVAGRVDVGQGIFFPGSSPAVPWAQGGNVISFGHPGASEDQLVYYNHWFYFMDSPGGGDEAQPGVSVGILQIRGGADLAEPFDVSGSEVEPGMVVVIDAEQPGKLKLSAKAYDRTVAGVVSGAGGVQSGLVMGQEGSVAYGKQNVALTGRVYCWCDASTGAIQPGDLLTTSDTPGHAMKAADRERAHGTIVGKAMTALPQGERGLVLVLVNLQ